MFQSDYAEMQQIHKNKKFHKDNRKFIGIDAVIMAEWSAR